MILHISKSLLLLALVCSFLFVTRAHAEGVVWNNVISGYFSPGYMESTYNVWLAALANPNISVRYEASATNNETGQSICGQPIAVGSNVTLEFKQHLQTDITWNATGGNWDTPYGDWSTGAARTGGFCQANDLVSGFTSQAWGSMQFYAPFRVAPPAERSIAGFAPVLNCEGSTPDASGRISCTAVAPGQSQGAFTFGPTVGRFYFHTKASQNTTSTCAGALGSPWFGLGVIGLNEPMRLAPSSLERGATLYGDRGYTIGSADYTSSVWVGSNIPAIDHISIPAQTISCPITVVAANGNPPTTPKLASTGACIVGAPHTITMQATDPDNDQLRYGIDWNADGSIDQFVPATSYVPSGTTQTASRTYAVAGEKSVKVLAQDTSGLSSAWATLAFNCAESATVGLNETDTQTTNSNQSSAPATDLTLRVIPSLIKSGNTTNVNWSASGVSSCTVTAPNGDAWSTLQSAIGGNISKPITGQTTYTLSCIDAGGTTQTKTATVNVIPTFQEI